MRLNAAKRESISGYAFISPFLVLFIVFALSPTVLAVFMSVMDWYERKPIYVGLNNIETVLHDRRFWQALWNTFYYSVMFVPTATAIAFWLALGIAKLKNRRLMELMQATFYLPGVVSLVAIAVVWRYIFNREFGLLNYLLSLVGISPINWLGDPRTALPSLALMSIVTGLGGGIIIFVAAILGLPSELYDAAHIDGADGWREVVYITIPLLTPTILYVLVATTIGALQVFVPIHLLTGGGPAGATLSLAYLIYRYAFVFLRVGYGATAGVALLFITLGLTVLQFNWFRTAVEY